MKEQFGGKEHLYWMKQYGATKQEDYICKHHFIKTSVNVEDLDVQDNFEIEICDICYFTKAEIELKTEQDAHQLLRKKLKGIEWARDSQGYDACPACGWEEREGHVKDCWLKAEIDKGAE